MIVKDSIRVDAFLDAHRHRSKFIIDAQKVLYTEPYFKSYKQLPVQNDELEVVYAHNSTSL